MTSAPEPGWYPDPEMPGQMRWWTGVAWGDDRQPSDQLAVANPTVGPSAPQPRQPLFAGIPSFFRSRADMGPVELVAGLAGFLLGAGLLALLGTSFLPSPLPGRGFERPNYWPIAVMGLILIGIAWAIPYAIKMWGEPKLGTSSRQLLPAATALAAVGVTGLVTGLANLPNDGATIPLASFWWPPMLGTIALAALWAFPGLQARPFLLGAALTSFGFTVAGFFTDQLTDSFVREPISDPLGYLLTLVVVGSRAGVALMIVAVALAAAAGFADVKGARGLATPIIAAGLSLALASTFATLISSSTQVSAQTNDTINLVFLVITLAAFLSLGSLTRRKATAAVSVVGLGYALVSIVQAVLGQDRAVAVEGLLITMGGMVVAAIAVAAMLWGPQILSRYEAAKSTD